MMDALLEVPAPDELPEGWRVGPVLDFFQLQRGHDLPVQDRRDGPVPVIASNGAVGFHDKSPLPGPGVVTGRSGTIGNVSFVEGAYWPLNTTLYVKDFKGTDPKFAYYFLQNFPLKDHQTGTGVPTLNRNDVHAVEVQFPPLDEQQRIAEVLRSVDEAIVAADLALAQTKQVRQSVVDVLLFPNNGHHRSELRRFRLSDLISIAHGFPFKSEYFTFERVDPILLTPGNFSVEKTLYFGERTKHYRGPVPDGYVLEEGSLVVVMTDLTQDMAILGNAIEIPGGSVILHNQRIGRVSLLKPDLIDLAYVRLLLNSEPVQSRIKATASGSTVRHTAPSRILECEIELPPLDEQARIVEIAKSLDDLVVAEERRRSNVEAIGALAHLRDLRGTIAADLLSGRVRVPQSNVVPIRSNVQPAFKRAVFAAEIVHQLDGTSAEPSRRQSKV